MNTLNHWLGRLQSLQLFGHGVKPLKVIAVLPGGLEAEWEIVDARVIGDTVYIELEQE